MRRASARLVPTLAVFLIGACRASHGPAAGPEAAPGDAAVDGGRQPVAPAAPDGGGDAMVVTGRPGLRDAAPSGRDATMTPGGPDAALGDADAASGDAGSDGSTDADILEPEDDGTSYCLEGIRAFADDGGFDFEVVEHERVKMWVPTVPAGCRVPVIHHANGTGAACSSYALVLARLASHGFLTTCYESPNTGSGERGVEALERAFELYPDLVRRRIGTSGHEAGGQGAFVTLQLAEAKWGRAYRYAAFAMQPATGFGSQPPGGSWEASLLAIRSPVLMFSGTADVLVSSAWVQRAFEALSDDIEAYHWSAIGATHIPVPQAEAMEVVVPWFRWKLLGDAAACRALRALPDTDRWAVVDEQNADDC